MLFTKKKRMNNPVLQPLPPVPQIHIEKMQYSLQFTGESSSIRFVTHETPIVPDELSEPNKCEEEPIKLERVVEAVPTELDSEVNRVEYIAPILDIVWCEAPIEDIDNKSLPSEPKTTKSEPKTTKPARIIPPDRIPIPFKKNTPQFKKTTYFVSVTTTPRRIHKLLQNLLQNDMFRNGIHKVIINVAHTYKRFSNDKMDDLSISTEVEKLNARNNYEKYVVNYTIDKGPITKLLGGVQYIRDNVSECDNNIIVVVDDDTNYMNNCIKQLCDCVANRQENALFSYSGFKFGRNHEFVEVKRHSQYTECDIIEGFAGISLRCDDVDDVLIAFTNYYYTIDWHKSNTDEVNRFLQSCFLGDDMVISHHFMYKNYKMIRAPLGMKSISQNAYGFKDDALHKTPVFLSNINSYAYLRENLHIYSAFLLKSKVCGEIRRMIGRGSF